MSSEKKEFTIDHGDGKVEYIVEETSTTTTKMEEERQSFEYHESEEKVVYEDGAAEEKATPGAFETVIDSKEIREVYNTTGELDYVQSPEEKALVRRLDFVYVMPCIAVMNFLQVKEPMKTRKC
jgi:hypothetical protein